MRQSELKSPVGVSTVRLLATTLGLCVAALAGSALPSSGERGESETLNASGKLGGLQLTPAAEVHRQLEMRRAAKAPFAIAMKQRLGATHYDGKYSLTDEPYLLEGAKTLKRLGFSVIKLWFNVRALDGYGYHSAWNVSRDAKMVDLAQHPYFLKCFRMPFSTFVLEATPFGPHGAQLWLEDDAFFAETEKQTYDLSKYLLETFRDREVTFIIQNWEGDWMTRDPTADGYSMAPASDWPRRFAALDRWFEARQKAVARARLDVPNSRARVLHAVEVNRVLESLRGVPTLTTELLPHLDVDLVSWSAYDGLNDVVHAWWGVEIIRHFVRPHADGTRPPIFIGEIGYPENVGNKTEASTREWWNQRLGVFFAQELPLIIVWELYCNEPNTGKKGSRGPFRAEGLRGFWLARPDGSLSWSGRYLHELLNTPATALDEVQAGSRVLYPPSAELAQQGHLLSRAESPVGTQIP